MALPAPIDITPQEGALIRHLSFRDLRALLTEVDELGWIGARTLLRELARRPEYRKYASCEGGKIDTPD